MADPDKSDPEYYRIEHVKADVPTHNKRVYSAEIMKSMVQNLDGPLEVHDDAMLADIPGGKIGTAKASFNGECVELLVDFLKRPRKDWKPSFDIVGTGTAKLKNGLQIVTEMKLEYISAVYPSRIPCSKDPGWGRIGQ